MNAQQILTLLRSQVEKSVATGAKGISFPDLDAHLAKLQKVIADLPAEAQSVEPIKAQHDFSLAQYNWQKDTALEMFRSVITTGQTALKSCMLINGGAAVALLAFIGHAASNADTKNMVPLLAFPLSRFVLGALASAVASGGTYLAQFLYGHNRRSWGHWINALTILIVIISYVLFACGSYSAYQVFLKL